MKKRVFCILLAAMLLAISTFPVAAEARHIPLKGTCEIVAMGGEDIPSDPNYRQWDTLFTSHWRNQLWLLYCDFNDDRLDGYLLSSDNFNIFSNGPYFGRNWAEGYSANAAGEKLDLWEMSAVGTLDWDFIHTIFCLYKGRGIYQGLLAQTTWVSVEYPFYDVEGVLIDPGN